MPCASWSCYCRQEIPPELRQEFIAPTFLESFGWISLLKLPLLAASCPISSQATHVPFQRGGSRGSLRTELSQRWSVKIPRRNLAALPRPTGLPSKFKAPLTVTKEDLEGLAGERDRERFELGQLNAATRRNASFRLGPFLS